MTDPDNPPSAFTELKHLLHRRRSIRAYKPDPVDEALIQEILEMGIHTSSSGNMQTYSIVVTRDRAVREALYEPHMNQNMVLDAPVLLTFCADFHRMRRWASLSGAADSFDDMMGFMVAAIDATLVSQSVALAAEARGLGICYMGSTIANCDRIGKILKLPKNVFPVVGFSVGYPAEDPAPRDRLPLGGLVHRDTYREYTDTEIRDIYRERETNGWKRYMGFAKLRKMIEESGVTNLAQVYTQLKYTKKEHAAFSKQILDYLEAQDFMN